MNCPACQSHLSDLWKLQVLNKYDVQYFKCHNCDLVCTEKPYWLNEAYQQSINDFDTGLVKRNLMLARRTKTLIKYVFSKRSTFLDSSGGYGLFVRLMRDSNLEFYWNDPYTKNLFAKGYEQSTLPKDTKFDLITSFEVIEHVEDPIQYLDQLFKMTDNILISTELVPQNLTQDWLYLGPEHGQHITFHSKKSLSKIAEKLSVNLTSLGQIHFFSKKKRWNVLPVMVLSSIKERLNSLVW